MKYFIILCVFFLSAILSSCAGTKEALKGFIGISTKVLEDGRGTAVKKDFGDDLAVIHNKTRKILLDYGAYIYCDDLKENLIAIYVSKEDTTPVGIFLTDIGRKSTRIEVSSPSTYAKETIAKVVFTSLVEPGTAIIAKEKGTIHEGKHKKVDK